MNTDAKMSYRDFIFPVNPRIINITHSKNIGVNITPFAEDSVTELGKGHRVISGEGEFFGKGCINDFFRLKKVFAKKGGGMLYIPSQKPFYAIGKTLELVASDIEGAVGYKFLFIESFENVRETSCLLFIGNGNSCLWDISYMYDTPIEFLISLNPHIKRPDIPISAGEKVRLC